MAQVGSRKSIFPVVLFVMGLGVLPWALVRQVKRLPESMQIFGAIFGVVYITWVLLESRITFGTAREAESSSDRGTVRLYGVARLLTMAGALAFRPIWQESGPLMVFAFCALLGGIGLRLVAIRRLGRFYSHQVRTLDEHRVVQDGPYRVVRHPAYTGMLLAHLGVVAFFCNAASLSAFVMLLLPSVVLRILVEEQAMMRTVVGYSDYARDRKRLVPLVW